MVRQLRRLVLGLLLGALVGWLWLRRQQGAETVGEPAAPVSESDDRIVLPAWTGGAPRREEDSPVAGRIVLPEGVESAPSALANGDAGISGEPPARGGNGAEPDGLAGAETETLSEKGAPVGNGDMAPLTALAPEDSTAEVAEAPGSTVEGYCVRCKEQRSMVNVHPYTTANKRPALKGECAVCGAGMFKFIKE